MDSYSVNPTTAISILLKS